MIDVNFVGGADYQTAFQRHALEIAALRKMEDSLPLLDQAGQQVAAAHLQAAIDVLSSTILQAHVPTIAMQGNGTIN